MQDFSSLVLEKVLKITFLENGVWNLLRAVADYYMEKKLFNMRQLLGYVHFMWILPDITFSTLLKF
jgi:hypothetical protein